MWSNPQETADLVIFTEEILWNAFVMPLWNAFVLRLWNAFVKY